MQLSNSRTHTLNLSVSPASVSFCGGGYTRPRYKCFSRAEHVGTEATKRKRIGAAEQAEKSDEWEYSGEWGSWKTIERERSAEWGSQK